MGMSVCSVRDGAVGWDLCSLAADLLLFQPPEAPQWKPVQHVSHTVNIIPERISGRGAGQGGQVGGPEQARRWVFKKRVH